jgi:tRNA(His) guanylyltransferase
MKENTMKDGLGDYLKNLESKTTHKSVSDARYIYMRLDGRAFSSLTKKMNKPIDYDFFEAMTDTCRGLFLEFSPVLMMKQSDEISILWTPLVEDQQRLFGGKEHKLLSVIPSFASSIMTRKLENIKPISFDARLVEVDLQDAILFFWWRYKDCYRNSISMVASSYMSHKELQNKTMADRLEAIEHTYIWKSAPTDFKYGHWLSKGKSIIQPDDPRFDYIPEKYRPTISKEVSTVDKLLVDKPFEGFSDFKPWLTEILLKG